MMTLFRLLSFLSTAVIVLAHFKLHSFLRLLFLLLLDTLCDLLYALPPVGAEFSVFVSEDVWLHLVAIKGTIPHPWLDVQEVGVVSNSNPYLLLLRHNHAAVLRPSYPVLNAASTLPCYDA